MSFSSFLLAQRAKTLDKDAAWRAYDIPAAVQPKHVREALKYLSMGYAREFALPAVMAMYGIPSREEAKAALGAYWIWSRVSAGRRVRGLQKRGYPPTKNPEEPPSASS